MFIEKKAAGGMVFKLIDYSCALGAILCHPEYRVLHRMK